MKWLVRNHLIFLGITSLLIMLTACSHRQKISLPAYIEGKYTYLSTNYSGILKSVYVNAGDTVKAGQSLFSLESLPESAEMQAALARVKAAADLVHRTESKFMLIKSDFQRSQYLYKKEVISKDEYDTNKSKYFQILAQLKSDEQNLSAKQADLEKAKWAVQQKDIYAPISSLVFEIYYYQGELVPAAKPVISLMDPKNLKVVFYVSEINLRQIRLNQNVEVSCDGCDKPFIGKINYISNKAEYTPPVIYSNEERAKLVYRVEAVPQLPNVTSVLHSGQPVTVTIPL
jgi:HlyD family secretion protein